MKFTLATIAAAALLPSVVFSTPLSGCQPNFQGGVIKIKNIDTKNWVSVPVGANVGSSVVTADKKAKAAGVLIQNTGSWPALYDIKIYGAPANNLIISEDVSRKLVLDAVTSPKHLDVLCKTCRPPGTLPFTDELVGGECKIVDPLDNYYVTELADGSYQLKGADAAQHQVFNLFAAPN